MATPSIEPMGIAVPAAAAGSTQTQSARWWMCSEVFRGRRIDSTGALPFVWPGKS
ncbi:MAG: hypothetical protein QOH48_990 [Actinomycetota bacterium]|jgi:hypothetical protein|nr:hypothetical protein [Actinomycetota bacterium]